MNRVLKSYLGHLCGVVSVDLIKETPPPAPGGFPLPRWVVSFIFPCFHRLERKTEKKSLRRAPVNKPNLQVSRICGCSSDLVSSLLFFLSFSVKLGFRRPNLITAQADGEHPMNHLGLKNLSRTGGPEHYLVYGRPKQIPYLVVKDSFLGGEIPNLKQICRVGFCANEVESSLHSIASNSSLWKRMNWSQSVVIFNIEMLNRVRSRSVHKFCTCKENAVAQCRLLIVKRV